MSDILVEALSPQTGFAPTLNEATSRSVFAAGLSMFSAQSGALRWLHPELEFRPDGDRPLTAIGAGCATDAELAKRKAVYEALERHAAAVYDPADILVATAAELGREALSKAEIPVLFSRDGAGNRWKARDFDARAPIRWVRGFDLVQRRDLFVPLVMAHIFVRPLPGEDFWPQSTSGVAAHTSLELALVSAIFELIERDAAELVWTLRLPLPEIADAWTPPELAALAATDRAQCVDQRYYDATGELAVPTVYAVRRLAPPIGHDVIVSCAADRTVGAAMLRARCEAGGQQLMRLHESGGTAYSRFEGEAGWPLPRQLRERPDLSFLGAAGADAVPGWWPASDAAAGAELDDLVSRLAPRHPHVIALNLATGESRRFGVQVARVIVPTLATVAPGEHEKFLRHPRLDQVSRQFCRPSPRLADLNLAPQPFC